MTDTTHDAKALDIETRTDLGMVRRALKQGWPMDSAVRDATMKALLAKLDKGPAGVPERTYRAYRLTLQAFAERDCSEQAEVNRQLEESPHPQRTKP